MRRLVWSQAEIEDLVLGCFLALGAVERSRAGGHLWFWCPGEGVAQFVRRRLYFAVRKFVTAFGARDDPPRREGVHDLRSITMGIRKL
jgi:hypothetical protein